MVTTPQNSPRKFYKKIRLGSELYEQAGRIVSVTICTNKRKPFFKHSVLAGACNEILLRYITTHRISTFAYCLMPDYLHLLMSPTDKKGIVDIVRDLKSQMSVRAKKVGLKDTLWQRGFYDHFLRREESLESTVSYILNNPVRRGLVDEWTEYPYSRSPFLDGAV